MSFLSNRSPNPKLLSIPKPLIQHPFQHLNRPQYILLTQIQRCEPEPHYIWHSEIADHSVRNQGLHDCVGLGVAECYVGAAFLRVARRG